jgi:hypothetical protein
MCCTSRIRTTDLRCGLDTTSASRLYYSCHSCRSHIGYPTLRYMHNFQIVLHRNVPDTADIHCSGESAGNHTWCSSMHWYCRFRRCMGDLLDRIRTAATPNRNTFQLRTACMHPCRLKALHRTPRCTVNIPATRRSNLGLGVRFRRGGNLGTRSPSKPPYVLHMQSAAWREPGGELGTGRASPSITYSRISGQGLTLSLDSQ